MRIALIKRDPFVRNSTPVCTTIERGLTFREKVGVDDELVKGEVVEGTEKPMKEGRERGESRSPQPMLYTVGTKPKI